MGRAYNTHGRNDKCIQNIKRKTGGKKPHYGNRHWWKDGIKTDLEIKHGMTLIWFNRFRIHTVQYVIHTNITTNLCIPYNIENFLTSWATTIFLKRTLLQWKLAQYFVYSGICFFNCKRDTNRSHFGVIIPNTNIH